MLDAARALVCWCVTYTIFSSSQINAMMVCDGSQPKKKQKTKNILKKRPEQQKHVPTFLFGISGMLFLFLFSRSHITHTRESIEFRAHRIHIRTLEIRYNSSVSLRSHPFVQTQ